MLSRIERLPKANLLNIENNPPVEVEKIENRILENMEERGGYTGFSVEADTLLLMKAPPTRGDTVVFITPEYLPAIVAARILTEFINTRTQATTRLEIVHGLQLDDLELLERVGFSELVRTVSSAMEEFDGHECCVVTSGSFKPLSTYLTLLGIVYNAEVYCLSERGTSPTTIKVPSFPMTLDLSIWKQFSGVFELLKREGQVPQKKIWKIAGHENRGKLRPYLAMNGRNAELSGLGVLLNKMAQRTAEIRDPLTMAFSRSFMFERINQLTEQPEATTVMFLDIDHFKKVNDNHGHDVGDQVLAGFVSRIKEALAELSDEAIFGRLSGEEFIVLVPSADHNLRFQWAEKLRTAVAEAPIAIENQESLAISVSIGVSSCPLDHSDLNKAIKLADEALYHAKEAGRNKVVVYGETKLNASREFILNLRELSEDVFGRLEREALPSPSHGQ